MLFVHGTINLYNQLSTLMLLVHGTINLYNQLSTLMLLVHDTINLYNQLSTLMLLVHDTINLYNRLSTLSELLMANCFLFLFELGSFSYSLYLTFSLLFQDKLTSNWGVHRVGYLPLLGAGQAYNSLHDSCRYDGSGIYPSEASAGGERT